MSGYKPELRVSEGTYKNKPCYFVNISDKWDMAFLKSNLKLVWAEDYHLGEVYTFKTKDDLEYVMEHFDKLYKSAYGAVVAYNKDPTRYNAVLKRNIDFNTQKYREYRKKLEEEKPKREAFNNALKDHDKMLMKPHLGYPYIIEVLGKQSNLLGYAHAKSLAEARKVSYSIVAPHKSMECKIYTNTEKGHAYSYFKNGYVFKGWVRYGQFKSEDRSVIYWDVLLPGPNRESYILKPNGMTAGKIEKKRL